MTAPDDSAPQRSVGMTRETAITLAHVITPDLNTGLEVLLAAEVLRLHERQDERDSIKESLAMQVMALTERLDVEEIAHEHTIEQRDDAQEAADRLAYAIAPQSWIGEHTSEVNPWDRAYEVTGEWAAEGLTLAETCKRLTERLAAVEALHRRRPHEPMDFIRHGQTEFPDLCDHCRRPWPCETADALRGTDD